MRHTKGTVNLSAEALVAIVLAVGVIAFGVYGLNKGRGTSEDVSTMGSVARSRLEPTTVKKCADWHDDGYPMGIDVLEYTYSFKTIFSGTDVSGCKEMSNKIAKAKEEGIATLKFDSDVQRCADYCAKIAGVRNKCQSQKDPQSCMATEGAKIR
jgi:hypothetical protein